MYYIQIRNKYDMCLVLYKDSNIVSVFYIDSDIDRKLLLNCWPTVSNYYLKICLSFYTSTTYHFYLTNIKKSHCQRKSQ